MRFLSLNFENLWMNKVGWEKFFRCFAKIRYFSHNIPWFKKSPPPSLGLFDTHTHIHMSSQNWYKNRLKSNLYILLKGKKKILKDKICFYAFFFKAPTQIPFIRSKNVRSIKIFWFFIAYKRPKQSLYDN